jgi:DNA repair protein RadC
LSIIDSAPSLYCTEAVDTKTRTYRAPGFTVSLVREASLRLAERPEMKAPADAAKVLSAYIGDRDRECFVAAFLTIRHRLLGLHCVSVGCGTSAVVHAREVFKPAILIGSAALLIAHNHPSGDPTPSAEDITLTRRLVAAGALLGIDVLDHLVLGEHGRYVSLKERGLV